MWLIILLILLGVLFLVAELVLLPGVSLGALFALVCYGSAIYTAFADYGPFTGGIVVLIILALSFVATVLSLRSKTWQRFSLKQKIESSSMPLPDNEVKAATAAWRSRAWLRWARSRSAAGFTRPSRPMSISTSAARSRWVGFENFNVVVRKVADEPSA